MKLVKNEKQSNTRAIVDGVLRATVAISLAILALSSVAIAERLKPQEQLIRNVNALAAPYLSRLGQ